MKIVFISNFMNHHQLPFCLELFKKMGSNFKFIATEKIPDDRIKLGYEDMNKKYDFIVRAYENKKEAKRLAYECDILIIGSAPDEYVYKRLLNNKIILRYSERVFKKGFSIKTFISLFFKRAILERNNTYLLCASAYAAEDYNKAFAYKNKTFKWGYFPEVIVHKNIMKLIEHKVDNSILWVSRFIDWKHPEIVIEIAKRLKNENIIFKINMIGIGKEFESINSLIKENKLEENVILLGSMSPNDVRKYMDNSKIFLFTSDRNEGWGAVLNEAMNSACSVIVSHEVGSSPYLVKDNVNGLLYEDGNIDDLYSKVKKLLKDTKKSNDLGIEAYKTIVELWNSKVASQRMIELSTALLRGNKFEKYQDGPCSKAKRIKDNWIK